MTPSQGLPPLSAKQDVVVTLEQEKPVRRNHVTAIASARFGDRYTVTVEALTKSDRYVEGAGTYFRDRVETLGSAYLQKGDSIRISVADGAKTGSRWEAFVLPPVENETIAVLERVSPASVVVRRCGGDYGFCIASIKLFFDLESKAVLGRVEFQPLAVRHFVIMDNRFYSVEAADYDFVVARYNSGKPQLVGGTEKGALIASLPPSPPVPTDRMSFLQSGALDSFLTPEAQPDHYVEMGRNSGFWLSRGAGSLADGVEGVVERTGNGYHLHALPQSTPEEFAQQRSAHQFVQRNVQIERSQVREEIGPYAIDGRRLWFGKTFYDGEGIVGVGSLGYFDLEKRAYTLFSPQAIADWSTSAILVEEAAVWAGMVRRPEGAVYSGGLLRFDPSSGQTDVYPIKDVIQRIARWRDALFVGTSNGVYVIRSAQSAARFVFEPTMDGGFEILAVNE